MGLPFSSKRPATAWKLRKPKRRETCCTWPLWRRLQLRLCSVGDARSQTAGGCEGRISRLGSSLCGPSRALWVVHNVLLLPQHHNTHEASRVEVSRDCGPSVQ